MSIPNDPLYRNNFPVQSPDQARDTIDYLGRAKKFAVTSAVIALVTAIFLPLFDMAEFRWAWNLVFVFPLSFSFSYLAFRSASQAKSQGLSIGYVKYLAALPFVGLGIVVVTLGLLMVNDTTGWAGLGVILSVFMMMPGTLVAIILTLVINRFLKKKDQSYNPAFPANSVMISVFRVMSVLALIPVLYFGYLWITLASW